MWQITPGYLMVIHKNTRVPVQNTVSADISGKFFDHVKE